MKADFLKAACLAGLGLMFCAEPSAAQSTRPPDLDWSWIGSPIGSAHAAAYVEVTMYDAMGVARRRMTFEKIDERTPGVPPSHYWLTTYEGWVPNNPRAWPILEHRTGLAQADSRTCPTIHSVLQVFGQIQPPRLYAPDLREPPPANPPPPVAVTDPSTYVIRARSEGWRLAPRVEVTGIDGEYIRWAISAFEALKTCWFAPPPSDGTPQ